MAPIDRVAALMARVKGSLVSWGQPSIFRHTLLVMGLLIVTVWPINTGVSYLLIKNASRAPFDRALEQSARFMAQAIASSTTDTLALSAEGATKGRLWQVRDAEDRYVAGPMNLPLGPERLGKTTSAPYLREVREGTRLLFGAVQPIEFASVRPGGERHTGPETTLSNRRPDGGLFVEVLEDDQARVAHQRDLLVGTLMPQLVAVPLAFLLIFVSIVRGVRSIKTLESDLAHRRFDDFSHVKNDRVPRELTWLVQTLNDQYSRLARYVDAQKRFVANAAHQLKTPITGLKAHAELGLMACDPEEALQVVKNRADEMVELIRALLDLAALDNPESYRLQFQPFDIRSACQQAVDGLQALAVAKQVEVQMVMPQTPCLMNGHAGLVSQLVSNLVDNAVRHSQSGQAVRVQLSKDAASPGWMLLVEDEGPGFSAQARAQLFQRFSRSNSHLGLVKGYGLGLAIVRQIADLHQAVVSVQNRRPDGPAGAGGARIHVTFPAVLQPTH